MQVKGREMATNTTTIRRGGRVRTTLSASAVAGVVVLAGLGKA